MIMLYLYNNVQLFLSLADRFILLGGPVVEDDKWDVKLSSDNADYRLSYPADLLEKGQLFKSTSIIINNSDCHNVLAACLHW